ncbi:MAG: molybdopterin-dependent oxidoreductase [Alphaproteobacteria bacterium]|nr:molybdopterin-dependent oxidoreductase [Alphaproteobacteria bacterium]
MNNVTPANDLVFGAPEGSSRRSVLKMTGAASGGLVLGVVLNGAHRSAEAATGDTAFAPNAFLEVNPSGRILIYSKAPEIGQGIKTAFPMIVAEELDAAWDDVDVEQAPINPDVYGRQSAGGSFSILGSWDQLRQAGAAARSMLVSAAAEQWRVDAESCSASDSHVIHPDGETRLSYAALASAAAQLPVPDVESLTLKDRADYDLLGTWVGGVENEQLVTGQPLFGTDQVLPDMVYATYQKCPAFGGTVVSANLDHIRSLDGVLDAFVLDGTGIAREYMPGVAIVAKSTWSAIQAKAALEVEWDETAASKDSWMESLAQARALTGTKGPDVKIAKGDVDAAMAEAETTVEAFYSYPFVSHAPMEPQNCTAWHRGDEVEIWAPTQTPERGVSSVAEVFNVPADKVTLHQVRSGGGFGRRLYNDFIIESVAISERVGAPVKLQWTREDDTRHDFYRAGGFHHMSGSVDADGKLTALRDHNVTFTTDGERAVTGGELRASEFPVPLIENAELTQTLLPWTTPCGAWRAPGSNVFGFVFQSFLHELSSAAGRDHVEFLLELLGEPRWLDPGNLRALHTGRTADVIKLAAEKAGWGQTLPDGHHLGVGFYFSHAGHIAEVAEVAEVSVEGGNALKIHKVTVAADVGPIVNMSGAKNQCEGSVIDGISTMLGQQLSIESGRIKEGNFDQYPLLKMADAPHVDVHFIQSDNIPTGLGEPALPPVAPAVCNAIYAATGQRVRSLPLSLEGFAV